jgi:hypothetical protein
MLVASLVAAIVVAGCGSPGPTPAPGLATSAPAASSEPVVTAAPASPATPATPAGSADGATVEDRSLLEILPAAIEGNTMIVEDGAFEVAVGDPDFAASIAAAAFGTYVSGDDLASAVVARPVAGAYSEAWFRDWRDSYDTGTCDQAGGLVATAETELGGRTVYAGTCAGGLHTYHAWIDDRGLLVSAFSVGEQQFGEQLMAGLRP